MSCLNHQARVRELWILIHHHHIPSSGSTTLTLWFKGLSLAICPTPTHALKGPAADQTAECPQAPVKAPKSCLGQGKHEPPLMMSTSQCTFLTSLVLSLPFVWAPINQWGPEDGRHAASYAMTLDKVRAMVQYHSP
ncbi:hypothetical protein FOC1_g10013811 [Fusarium oxysporum f. sp. cubense race 1]|uniref:Uncharacterized protein n=1 Tax=Fusarium oxysporum f. sp. cubense (strain race 1) TaxID=1229664 RepID=N4TLZ6_FUSC1|nr:hypothetical protein FOC1_g10013811 [Fusarium oxysporum f. sp. cubense race 1]